MREVINLGPFLLQYKLFILICGVIIGYLVLSFFLKYKKDMHRNQILDIYTSVAFLVFITWKFGGVLLQPKVLFTNPSLVLFSSGTQTTLLMGIVLSTFYLVFKAKRQNISFGQIVDRLLIGTLPFLFIYHLFVPSFGFPTDLPWGVSISNGTVKYHPINMYFAIIIGLLLIIIFVMKAKGIGGGNILKISAITLGVTGLMVSFLFPQTILVLNLSRLQWISIAALIAGIVVRTEKENTDEMDPATIHSETK